MTIAKSSPAEHFVRRILGSAGIEVDGNREFDIIVHDPRVYAKVLTQGTLGLGESYMLGWWDAANVDDFVAHLVQAEVQRRAPIDFGLWWTVLRASLFNLQERRAFEVGRRHYDLGNDLYEAMLDKRMIYSCGYWPEAANLDEAQEAKLDMICRKAQLAPGQRVLDIGCGWGGFLKFAAEKYGVSGVGITVSEQQANYARQAAGSLPVEFRLEDYRAVEGSFDRVVSIGMFEHVGLKNYRIFMQKARHLLSEDGLMVLHTIGGNYSVNHGDPWSDKYIFPNGMLPSQRQIAAAAESIFVMEDWHNFGADYDRTLMAWHVNFERAWPELSANYDEVFHRMWRYYLLSFAAMFRTRHLQLWQIVLSPAGVRGGYRSPR